MFIRDYPQLCDKIVRPNQDRRPRPGEKNKNQNPANTESSQMPSASENSVIPIPYVSSTSGGSSKAANGSDSRLGSVEQEHVASDSKNQALVVSLPQGSAASTRSADTDVSSSAYDGGSEAELSECGSTSESISVCLQRPTNRARQEQQQQPPRQHPALLWGSDLMDVFSNTSSSGLPSTGYSALRAYEERIAGSPCGHARANSSPSPGPLLGGSDKTTNKTTINECVSTGETHRLTAEHLSRLAWQNQDVLQNQELLPNAQSNLGHNLSEEELQAKL